MNADVDDDHQVECESAVAHPPFYAAPVTVCAVQIGKMHILRCGVSID